MRITPDPTLQLLVDGARSAGEAGQGSRFASALTEAEQVLDDADALTHKATLGEVDLHDAALALERADIQMRLLVSVRNKVVEAYQEVMRMPV